MMQERRRKFQEKEESFMLSTKELLHSS